MFCVHSFWHCTTFNLSNSQVWQVKIATRVMNLPVPRNTDRCGFITSCKLSIVFLYFFVWKNTLISNLQVCRHNSKTQSKKPTQSYEPSCFRRDKHVLVIFLSFLMRVAFQPIYIILQIYKYSVLNMQCWLNGFINIYNNHNQKHFW